jgi:hypothetical protein
VVAAEATPALAAALRYAGTVLAATALELALLLGPGFALAAALHALGDFVTRRMTRHLGGAAYALFGWPGTIVHELGHAVFCVIFGHRITGMRLFDFAPRDGTRGHVAHTFDPASPWQQIGNFFIGVGPILFGTLAIVAAARWLLGPAAFEPLAAPLPASGAVRTFADGLALAWHVAGGALASLGTLLDPQRWADWRTWLFLYLAFAVGGSISLSGADLKGALAGFGALVLAVLVVNLATLWVGDVPGMAVALLARWLAVGWAAMLFALLVNTLAALLVLPVSGLLARLSGRAG